MSSKPTVVAVLPARMGSSRFPGKPLARLLGLPMIEHVYRRTSMCSALKDVYVATCDSEIQECVQGFGGKALMTSSSHQRASDRIAEAARYIDADIFVMVQGDEPMVFPQMIESSVAPLLANPEIGCVNLAKRITSQEEYHDPNTIKVVTNLRFEALYFSREPIPTHRLLGYASLPLLKQVCIIPFRRELLQTYARLEPTPLELAESVDMLRLLEHGIKVHMVETQFETCAVDTPADLERVASLMKDDPLLARYATGVPEGSQV